MERDFEQTVEFTRIRLCLPASRDGEVRDFLTAQTQQQKRDLATIWWDKTN
jgi:hypothetical protein